jgi:hypothetical protein
MTKKLEDAFGLPPIDSYLSDADTTEVTPTYSIAEVTEAMEISDRINTALAEVRGMESHDGEMDEISKLAVDSYEELMRLGMNMTDMAAGPVFSNASQMLKIALEARDSKVTRKLKQIDLMLKKANLDARVRKNEKPEEEEAEAQVFDRNALLKMLSEDNKPQSDK